MARTAVLLKALARDTWRELKTLQSVSTNNFFLFCFIMLPQSGAFAQVILGLLLFFPLSADPMRRMPADRLALWPVSTREKIVLRLLSFWLSPAIWIAVALFVWGSTRYRPLAGQLVAVAIAANVISAVMAQLFVRAPRANLLRDIPSLHGTLGGLVRKNLREMLHMLDPYAGLVLASAGTAYRLASPHPEPDAYFGVSMLVSVALSTYAQRLFALDAARGFLRYRLLPLRGWQVLAAKDAAYLLLQLALTLPLAPLTGIAMGLAALAVGHHASVTRPEPQSRWHFTAGASLGGSIVQAVTMFGVGAGVYRSSPMWILPCVAAFAVSLVFYGRKFERQW